MAVKVVSFPSDAAQTRSQKVKIPNLTSIIGVTVNTGDVTYSVSGDEVTLNVKNGAYVSREAYTEQDSKYVTNQNSSNYSDGSGYSGSLDSYVHESSDSKIVTEQRTQDGTRNVRCNSSLKWEITSQTSVDLPSSISYNSGGYSGTLLSEGDYYSSSISAGESCPANGRTSSVPLTITRTYSAYVVKPAVYRYRGYVYRSYTAYRNYKYAYEVTITYVDRDKISTIKIRIGSATLSLPVYNPSVGMSGKNQLRVQTGKGVGCFELVETNDSKASPLRVRTSSGIKAVAKE